MGNSPIVPTQKSYESSSFKKKWEEWDEIVGDAGGDVTDRMIIAYSGKKHAVTVETDDDDVKILERDRKLAAGARSALWDYGNNGHEFVNAAIRDDNEGNLKKCMPKIWFIHHFIDRNPNNFWRMPKCKPSEIAEHKILWRGSHLTEPMIEKINDGEVYRLATIVSTSLLEMKARTWRGDTIIQFHIPQGCRAAHIGNRTPQGAAEEEVLLAAYTPVLVIRKGVYQHRTITKKMIVMRVLPFNFVYVPGEPIPVRWAAGYEEGGARVGGGWSDEERAPGRTSWLDEDLLLPCPDSLCDKVYADHQRLVAENRALKKELRRIAKLIRQAAGLM